MIKSKIKLIIFILNNETFKYNILSINSDKIILPYLEIKNYMDINKGIRHLMSLYLLNKDIVEYCDFKLSDIDVDDELNIYYYCFIPHDTEIKDSYKIPINQYECNLPNIQKTIRSLL